MLQIFYSTLQKQSRLDDTSQSLGGYVSTNSFQNNKLNSVFPILYDRDKSQCRLLILKNSATTEKSIILSLSTDSTKTTFSYGLVSPGVDDCNTLFFETIEDYTDPLYTTFSPIEEESSFTIEPQQCIGIWVKRHKLESITPPTEDIDPLDKCKVSLIEEVNKDLVENFNIRIEIL